MNIRRRFVLFSSFIGFAVIASTLLQQTGSADAGSHDSTEQALLDVVAKRIAAYNAHNIQEFLAAHDENVGIYQYPDRLLGDNRQHLQRIFEPQFARGEGVIEVVMQRVLGNRVVSEEYATVDGETEHLIVIYTIENGQIASLRLIE